MSNTSLRSRFQTGEVLYGTFMLANSPLVVEMIGYAGFDFVIIDCEHSGTSPFGDVEVMVRAADSVRLPAMVRIKQNNAAQIAAALDAGAQGVVIPHMRSAEEMKQALYAATWPPKGGRGVAPVVRAAKYGLGDWNTFMQAGTEMMIVPLIEDPEGVEHVDEIVHVDGISLLMFGAFDLAVAMGLDPMQGGDEIKAARTKVYQAAKQAGVQILDYAWDASAAHMQVEMGANGIALANDVSLLAHALRDLRASVKDTP